MPLSAAHLLRLCCGVQASSSHPVALVAVLDAHLAELLSAGGYRVVAATVGRHVRDLAVAEAPDVVILDPILEDMSGTDACRLLRSDPAVPRHLPILLALDQAASPELRVAALRVGIWDFVLRSSSPDDVILQVGSYVEAMRGFAESLDDGFIDPATGFRTRLGLVRRARELASLMMRVQAGCACVVVEAGPRARFPDLGAIVMRAARLCDVVGEFGGMRTGVLAPATDAEGAVRLAARIGAAVHRAARDRGLADADTPVADLIVAGYDAVGNAAYDPIDPFALLHRAATAVSTGVPDRDHPWVRRFSGAAPPSRPSWSRSTPAAVHHERVSNPDRQ